MTDTSTRPSALELGIGFTTDELAANRRGELLSGQYPPLFWKATGLCLVALVIVVCVRWALHSRGDRMAYVAGALALASLVPAGFIASGVADALRDRIDARACAFTHVASGVRGSPWGLGLYDVDIGQRAFSSRRGNLGQAVDAVQRGVAYTAYYACHSASLASLEPASAGWKLPELSEHLLELGQLFGFDAADLDANRAGEVNVGQLPFWRLAGTLFFVGLFAAGGIACWLELREKRTLSMLGLGLLCWLISFGVLYGKRAVFQDLVARRSCTLSGTVTDLTLRFGKTSTYWRLTVAGKTLEFLHPAQGSSLVRIGSGYSVHYLCHSEQLVSIEPLP
jgi:hypothetical protein